MKTKNFEDKDLEEILYEHPCQTQAELGARLGVTQQIVSFWMQNLDKIQRKRPYYVTNSWKTTKRKNTTVLCFVVLLRNKILTTVTDDENWYIVTLLMALCRSIPLRTSVKGTRIEFSTSMLMKERKNPSFNTFNI